MMRRQTLPLVALTCLAAFIGPRFMSAERLPPPKLAVSDRVVISAPVQLVLAGGDPFLAANFEAIRLAATSDAAAAEGSDDAAFRMRAHRVVAQLNPCHEDNYYVGNALLAWGGAPSEGSDLLKRAMDCRIWDEVPAFFYGFNQYFFLHDARGARASLEMAADRATHNATAFRRFGIMIEAGEIKDDTVALDFLQRERTQTADPKLQGMLDKRIARLQGLITLRAAQQRYEARFGQPLTNPQALIDSGELEAFPNDPLRIGYEFADGRFRLKELKIAGLERP